MNDRFKIRKAADAIERNQFDCEHGAYNKHLAELLRSVADDMSMRWVGEPSPSWQPAAVLADIILQDD